MNNSNKNLENFINKTGHAIRHTKKHYDTLQNLVKNTPIHIKILNVSIPFAFTYVFTYLYFNLSLSIIFAFITFFIILLLSKIIGVTFLILYIISIVKIIRSVNVSRGNPILQTDIIKNRKPYDCTLGGLTISNSSLAQDLYGGYFTYSFWIYLTNNNNNSNSSKPNDINSWHNYRYKEWKSVFYRGTPINSNGDLSSLVQFPGVWLTPVLNNLVIVFQNGSYVERLELNNIDFNSWTNFSIVVQTKSVSIYINGLLDRALNLYQNITVTNEYNLYIASDMITSSNNKSGFAGYLGELIFYNYALTPTDIYNSYSFYKKIITSYQKKLYVNNYSISGLITNSDYLQKK
jgi:hypothetical protein